MRSRLSVSRLFVERLAAMPASDIGKKTRVLLAALPKEQRDQEREKRLRRCVRTDRLGLASETSER